MWCGGKGEWRELLQGGDICTHMVDSCSSVDKESACSAGDPGSILGWEDLLEKEMATHSSILARKISWTEEPGGLQSTGSQRVGHDWFTYLLTDLLTYGWFTVLYGRNQHIEIKYTPILKIHKGKMYFNVINSPWPLLKDQSERTSKTKQNRILKRGLITFRSLDWISEESIKKLPQ